MQRSQEGAWRIEMDSQRLNSKRISELLKSRRVHAFMLACLILLTLVALQAANLKSNTPMCELLEDCNISNADLQRMQLAFGQSGLNEFKVVENRLMVPKAEHTSYLQAITANNAVPQDLRDKEDTEPAVNPFLSRTQQLAIERRQKKKQIRDMVVRLPFVEQAWFEMDKSNNHSAFQRTRQSAVVSIRPPENVPLSDNHVDTVKRMIGGAIAGLDLNEIVVIDLSAGYAHHESDDPSSTQQVRFQRIEFEQQRLYETRIRKALKDYQGIDVSVQVDVSEAPQKVAQLAVKPQVKMPTLTKPPSRNISDAGANGFATLEDFEPQTTVAPPTPISLVAHSTPPRKINKDISVQIDVPQQLVHEIFGAPNADSGSAKNQSDYRAALARDTQFKFGQLQSEIIRKVKPLLPRNQLGPNANLPIAVNLIRNTSAKQASVWPARIQSFVEENWPSAAVLLIGLILLSIVTRKQPTIPSVAVDEHLNDQVVLSMDHPDSNANPINAPATSDLANPEVRLSQLIEKDPNAAAKVIETWIRDAA